MKTKLGWGRSLVLLIALVAMGGTAVDAQVYDGRFTNLWVKSVAVVGGSRANRITLSGTATTVAPTIVTSGSDTNVGFNLKPKGSGAITLQDGSGNEVIVTGAAVASAVNEVTVTNAATGNPSKISATGGDTNISLELIPKGTGGIAIGSGGTPIAKYLSGTATVDLASIADGDDGVAEVTVTGAAVGDPAIAGLTTLTTEDVLITAKVSATNTVEVVFLNRSGGAFDAASGTLRASVLKH